jgi:hypothetical protein
LEIWVERLYLCGLIKNVIDMSVKKALLSTNNTKTIKGEGLGYKTYILYMSAYKYNSKGINVCSHASKGCAESCLVGSGFGGMYTGVQQGRINRTEYFLKDRVGFLFQLKEEIEKAIRVNEGKAIPVFRLNGTSDLPYEKYKVFEGKNIFEIFPDVQFYDYTKNYLRFGKVLPSNYHLTFSRSETNGEKAMELLSRGVNVAIVFDKLPETYMGYKVINADETDLRFLDEKGGVICGLKYKKMTGKGANNALAFESGFAIRTQGDKKKVEKKLEKVLVVSE